MSLTPQQHQALDEMIVRDRLLVIGEVGAGKTVVTSAALSNLDGINPITQAVIVTPSYAGSGPRHWAEELYRWAPDTVALPMIGSKAKRQQARDEFVEADNAVLLCTYDGMRSDLTELLALPFDTLVIDESHRLAGRTTAQAKAAMKLAKRARRLWFLDGTPVMNTAQDLWPIFHMIDPQEYRSYWRWAHQHLDIEERRFKDAKWVTKIVHGIRPGEEGAIREQLERHSVSFGREDPGEPPRQTVLAVDLSPAERRLFDQLEKHSFAEHDDQEVVAANPVSKLTRLRQISSDWSGVIDTDEPGSKVKAVKDLVKNGDLKDSKVVILCEYKATVRALLEAIGSEAVDYHGDIGHADRGIALWEFTTNPGARILVGTLGALGEGVDGLQHACHDMILVDRKWNHPANDQCIGRLFRHGQEHRVNVVHVVANGSADQTVAKALAEKAEITEALGL